VYNQRNAKGFSKDCFALVFKTCIESVLFESILLGTFLR